MEKVIHVDNEILGGTPVFLGTRVPVKNLFDYLEEGESIAAFLEDFPTVKKEQAQLILNIAHNLLENANQPAHENIAR